MNNMIERYVYAVTRRLPEAIRADVARELRSNIEDMLPEQPGEADIEKVLTELGSPAKLAVQYNPKPRFLISPELFDDYFMVLKVAAVSLAVILAAVAVFQTIFSDSGGVTASGITQTITALITGFVSGVYNGIIYAFFWVTVVFFCIEYYGRKREERPWSPKALPEVPKDQKSTIKRGESIADAVFSILFTIIFLIGTLRQPPFIAWYQEGQSVAPLFNDQLVLAFLPLFVIVMAATLVVSVLKAVKGRWCVSVAVSQVLYAILRTVVSLTFISRPDVFTEAFISRFADKIHGTYAAMTGYIHTGITVIIVLIVIGTLADIGTAIGKTARSYK